MVCVVPAFKWQANASNIVYFGLRERIGQGLAFQQFPPGPNIFLFSLHPISPLNALLIRKASLSQFYKWNV